MENCIETTDLTKYYGETCGIENLNMIIPYGKIFCLAGPNGSGKTTTLRILSTLLQQSSGSANVCGYDVNNNPIEVRESISVLQQATAVDPYLKVQEYLTVFCRMQNPRMSRRESLQKTMEIAKTLSFEQYLDFLPLKLSGGFRRRIQLAKTLLKDADLYILDEPTVGFDPEVYRITWAYIKRLKATGKTILFTTHNMNEAETNADEVAFMRNGRIVASGTPASLLEPIGKYVFEITTVKNLEEELIQNILRNTSWLHDWRMDNYLMVTFAEFDKATVFSEIMKNELVKRGHEISSVRIRKSELNDAYLIITGAKGRDAET